MLCSYQSSFKPPTFLRPAWIQTTLPALLRTREHSLPRQDEILELSDGDSLELAWFNPRHEAGSVRAIAIITHGLEGSINSSYVVGLTKALSQIGCLTLAWNMRGCGGRPNKLLSWYHSGKSDDLKAVIDNASRRYPELPIVLIGVSVGGNILCKYLGEQAQDVPSRILASVAISAPLDLRGSALCLARWSRRIYMEYLLRPLRARVREKARLFPGLINADGVESITDFYEFDRRYTAPLHGFESVDHYWDTCSGARYLSSVRTPLRLISALDDPFLSPGCFPFQEASRSKWITIETPKRGGHVGFIDSLSISQTWLDRRVCEVVSPLL